MEGISVNYAQLRALCGPECVALGCRDCSQRGADWSRLTAGLHNSLYDWLLFVNLRSDWSMTLDTIRPFSSAKVAYNTASFPAKPGIPHTTIQIYTHRVETST